MDRNLVFEKRPKFVKDLGSGYSNVYLNVREEMMSITNDDGVEKKEKRYICDVQKVKNPVTYEKTVNTAIKEEFPNGGDDAAMRKGITNPNDADFVAFNKFAEFIKTEFKKRMTE